MKIQTMLDDVRVIDLSQYIPGPFATRQLADLGADVIKIEPPGGDPMRRFMHREGSAPSPVYQHLNRGKRICALDLKASDGRDALAELIEGADVLLESFRPGALERLGFAREQLERLNPRLIHCALSGYGQTGPYAQRAGHELPDRRQTGQRRPSAPPQLPEAEQFPLVRDRDDDRHARTRLGQCPILAVSLFASLRRTELAEKG